MDSCDYNIESVWEIEDELQNARVFCNGFDHSKTAHMDSYMTCVDYFALGAYLKDNPFPVEQWKRACYEWSNNVNYSPPARLVSFAVQRHYGFEIHE